ncbi:hypothetical protein HIM_09311 [Hirsutella minnesotensis 3608]|uniref:GAT domain-containing protein n=1 Tax=Hirsutella minnesotensis 3608 TaxID=1043627 RepID=A0A0F7ZGQ5_9HYPO|nr:hypothetical protein HIM_09311 [Hirsutella minnesotensis 3608]
MKAMKGLSVNKMLGSIKRKTSSNNSPVPSPSATSPADSPEVTAHNSVKAFCESGGSVQSDEVLFLPPIVDAAESSPAAAAECARLIRKYLGKDYFSRPSWQYNALMLVRILTDNPGETFTRNLDDKFVDAAKYMLKNGRDAGVSQLLMETLDDFENTKSYDENLGPLIQMWKKEKGKSMKDQGSRMPSFGPRPPMPSPGPPPNGHSQNYFARSHSNHRLPNPVELASRLEEARTSAKLLEQVVMNTPPGEMLDNDLIKEFANRCLSASRSIQGYMVSENPAPDNDTMESLIDTNEQLQTALNQHQRAVLSARKQLGIRSNSGDGDASPDLNGSDRAHETATSVPMASGAVGSGAFASGSLFASGGNGKGKQTEMYGPSDGPLSRNPPESGPSRARAGEPASNPFEDPSPETYASNAWSGGSGDAHGGSSAPRHLPPPPPPPNDHRAEDDDLYEATPKSKQSVPRF